MPATTFYHNVHIKQLKALYKITGKVTFKVYADAWKEYEESAVYRLMAGAGRIVCILKKNGLKGTVKRYMERRKWMAD